MATIISTAESWTVSKIWIFFFFFFAQTEREFRRINIHDDDSNTLEMNLESNMHIQRVSVAVPIDNTCPIKINNKATSKKQKQIVKSKY